MSYAAAILMVCVAGELLPQYSLLVAIVVGVVLSAFGFAYTFARNSQLAPPLSGEEHCSTAVRSAAQEMKLGVLGRWYHIFTARGFLFFGTASSLYKIFKAHAQVNERLQFTTHISPCTTIHAIHQHHTTVHVALHHAPPETTHRPQPHTTHRTPHLHTMPTHNLTTHRTPYMTIKTTPVTSTHTITPTHHTSYLTPHTSPHPTTTPHTTPL